MQEVNPDLNAVVIDLSKQALRQTELADDAVKIEVPYMKVFPMGFRSWDNVSEKI